MDPVAPVSNIASMGRVRAWWPVLTDDVMQLSRMSVFPRPSHTTC